MKIPDCNLRSPRIFSFIVPVLSFIVIFVITALCIDPSVYYFLPRYEAINNLPSYPGQCVDAVASFLITTMFHTTWIGAFLIASLVCLICRITRLIFDLHYGIARAITFVPAIVILLHFVQPMHFLVDCFSVIIALASTLLYQRTTHLQTVTRFGIFLVLGVLLLYGAPNGFLIFITMAIFNVLLVNKNFGLALINAATAAFIPAVATMCFFPSYTIYQSYALVLKTAVGGLAFPLAFFHLLLLLFFPLCSIIQFVFKNKIEFLHVSMKGNRVPLFQETIFFAAIMVLFGITISSIPNSLFHRHASLQKAMLTENWDKIIEIGENTPISSLSIIHIHLFDRALYKKGRLLIDLFKITQNQHALLLDLDDNKLSGWSYFWKHVCAQWTYFDLGWINGAENSACEAASQGYHPSWLLLSKIYAIKAMPGAAQICLGRLSQDPAYRRYSQNLLAGELSDSVLLKSPDVAQAKSLIPTTDRLQNNVSPLEVLIAQNSLNRMAFEYRIAAQLIRGDLDSIAAAVPGFRALGYPGLPRLCEEALMLREMVTQKQPQLHGYLISKEASMAFKEYFTILLTKHKGQAKEAHQDLANFRYSYFYYCTYFMKNLRAEL